MAKPKKAPAKPKAAERKSSTVARVDPAELDALIAKIGRDPTAAQRAAWLHQYPAEITAGWAARTNASETELEAFNWAKTASVALLDSSIAESIAYPRERLVFLLECVQDVAASRERSASTKGDADSLRTTRDAAASSVSRALKKLRARMKLVAGDHAESKLAIRAAIAKAEPKSDESSQLTALVALANTWIADAGPLALLATEKGVTTALCAQCTESVLRFRAARAATPTAAASKDSPAVNAVEGRLLGEMSALRDALLAAREERGDKLVPMVLPRATAALFGKPSAAEKPESPET